MLKDILIISIIFIFTSCQKQEQSSSQWTYKVISSIEVMDSWIPKDLQNTKDSEKISKVIEGKLNEYGKKGWELVSFNGQVILKKITP